MNAELQKQYHRYACGIRCLVELAARRGLEIDPETILAQFRPKYPIWLSMPGAADVACLIEVARVLGLAGGCSVTRAPKRLQELSPLVEDRKVNGILVFTDKLPDPNKPEALCDTFHTMLLVKADANSLKVWNPYQDGKAVEEDVSWQQWEEWLMYALLLGS